MWTSCQAFLSTSLYLLMGYCLDVDQTAGEGCTSVVVVHLGKLRSYWGEVCVNSTGGQCPAALSKRRKAFICILGNFACLLIH